MSLKRLTVHVGAGDRVTSGGTTSLSEIGWLQNCFFCSRRRACADGLDRSLRDDPWNLFDSTRERKSGLLVVVIVLEVWRTERVSAEKRDSAWLKSEGDVSTNCLVLDPL